jgi:hypothetical protein
MKKISTVVSNRVEDFKCRASTDQARTSTDHRQMSLPFGPPVLRFPGQADLRFNARAVAASAPPRRIP